MLGDFITSNRENLIALCTQRAERRTGAGAIDSGTEFEFGTRHFLAALPAAMGAAKASAFARDGSDEARSLGLANIDSIAARHGMEMLALGAPLDWVVHEYGDVCQAITQLAQRCKAVIPTRDFEALNWCLDNAMASAVSEYAHQRELLASRESSETLHECLGRLADELRIPLAAAAGAVSALRADGPDASHAKVPDLEQNLGALREVIDRSLALIRLRSGMTACPETVAMIDLVSELSPWGLMEAQANGCRLVIAPVSAQLAVYADRALLVSSLRRLIAAACRSSAQARTIALRVLGSDSRVFAEVHDERSDERRKRAKLPARQIEKRGTSRSAPDPELTLVERGVQDNGGRLRMRDLPGNGRVYTIDFPRERMSFVR
jgi:K+-sensing histidine kinase KdpD